jgi:ATP-dependent helicase/nuclease subunit A
MSSPVGAVPGNAHAVGDGDGAVAAAVADASARARIRTDLGTSLVVVAGAGTGKTTELVGRVIDLVTHGTALREVAAITFTEAAAAELRSRLRDSLAAALSAAPSDTRLATALDEVDEAAICTLHAFAQRMLVEHCISVGLAPGFEVLDDVADVAEFEDRWSRFADALLDDPSAEPTLTRAFALGLQPRDLEAVAFELHANWDRVDDGMIAGARPEEKGHAAHPAPVDPAPVLEALDRVLESAAWCTDATDLLLRHIEGCLASARGRILAAGGDDLAVVQLLRTTRRFSCRNGNRDNWGGRAAEVRSLCDEAEEARLWALGVARVSVVGWLLTRLACFTLEAADERRREGRITFHDLLVLARRLLRSDAHATAALRRRYRRILVDEFQDSDPIQVELAARLAAVVAGRDDLAATRPGALFVVGDPKQAIYRFRRADIEMFDHVAHRVGERVELHTNFRSVPGILAYVNAVFAELLGDGEPGQAAHVDLVAWRPRLPGEVPVPGPVAAPSPPRPVQLAFDMAADTGGGDAPREPTRAAPAGPAPVVVLGGRLEVPAAEVRRAATLDAATALRQVVETGWAVAERGADPGSGSGSGPDGVITRPARWGDIAVLIPTRASLPPLSEALDELDVP